MGLDVTMWDYMANIYISTPLWEYKQPFRHRALLFIVGMENTFYTTLEQEITPTSHPLSWLELLECELNHAKESLLSSNPPRISYSDIEDVSDVYQERLEYNWWVEEQKELIKDLEVKITEHKATLSSEQLKLWESFNS